MWRRSTTTRLIVEASHMIHEMVVVLSDPEGSAVIRAAGNSYSRVALWRIRAASSRS